MPRGRKAQVPPPNAEPTPKPATENPPETAIKRRGRRTKSAEPVNETRVLIDVVLRGRGAKGATPDVLHSVVSWARSIREEGGAIKNGRNDGPRRQRSEVSSDRIARYEMNVALLNGVLSGQILLNVEENGELVFRQAGAGGETPAATSSSDAVQAEAESAGA